VEEGIPMVRLHSRLHGFIPLKVQLIITAAVRTSNLTKPDIMDLINISKEFESVREGYLEWLQSDVRV
jgi:hypothetical protein